MIVITTDNVNQLQLEKSVINKSRVPRTNPPMYILLNTLTLKLSDGSVLIIPEGFKWDLSSVPKRLWSLLPPDGDFELAALIHDYLYVTELRSRKFADEEMLIWSMVMNPGKTKFSWKKIDNYLRFLGVRIFGAKGVRYLFLKNK